jgi:hypothetical protein
MRVCLCVRRDATFNKGTNQTKNTHTHSPVRTPPLPPRIVLHTHKHIHINTHAHPPTRIHTHAHTLTCSYTAIASSYRSSSCGPRRCNIMMKTHKKQHENENKKKTKNSRSHLFIHSHCLLISFEFLWTAPMQHHHVCVEDAFLQLLHVIEIFYCC